MTMRKTILTVALLLALAPMAAYSVPIVQTATCVDSSNQCATGITGLESMGITFDVSFVTGSSYNAVYAVDDPYFLGDSAGAVAAIDTIVALLNGTAFGVVGEGSADSVASRILNPSSNSGTQNFGAIAYTSPTGSADWIANSYSTYNTTDFSLFEPVAFTAYAVFEVATVPEPSTLMLLSIGLLGLGWMGWRRKDV